MSVFKKTTSVIIICVLIACICSCNLPAADPEEILRAADNYSNCIRYLDSDRIIDNTSDVPDNVSQSLKTKLSLTDQDYDQALVKRTIAETITYEIDSESVTTTHDSGSCDVTFTMIDYESAIGSLVGYSEAYINALNDCTEYKSYKITLDFINVDGRWLATADCISRLDQIYAFLPPEYLFGPDTNDLLNGTSWLFSSNGSYENTNWIELDLWFTDNPEASLYYVVSRDDQELYTSEAQSFDGLYFRAPFCADLGAITDDSGFIEPGDYTISIYRDDGLFLAEETTTVTTDDSKEPITGLTETPAGAPYSINDPEFATIISIGWWDYDGTMVSDDVYCLDTNTISLSIKLFSDAPEVYYAFYFIPDLDADIEDADYSSPVYTDETEPVIYPDGTAYYNIEYAPNTIGSGIYVLVIAKDSSLSDPYITAYCKVITQTSDEF